MVARVVGTWVMCVGALMLGEVAAADPAPAAQADARIRALVRAGQAQEARREIDRLARASTRPSVEALARIVRAGQPDWLTDHVLSALARWPAPGALPLLAELTRHRRAAARRLAYLAIGAAPDAQAPALLATGLRDSDPKVRGACATLLGERAAREQLDLLFRALERGVPEAATAIGRIGDEAAVARFHDHLTQQPMAVMLQGYARFLEREDVDVATKLEIVARLGEVASGATKRFLLSVLHARTWPPDSRLRLALVETANRIDAKSAPKEEREAREERTEEPAP